MRKIQRSELLRNAMSVVHRITDAGYEAYIVGGAVRDLIMENEPHDADIATNMPMDELAKLWNLYDIGRSKDFGIVAIVQGNHVFEVAQYRQDSNYQNGRRPESVESVGSFKEDAARRDFTVNVMGIDADGNVIDYFHGRDHIKNRVLCAVGNPYDRFNEDYLRIMRLARFAAKLDFIIDTETKKAAVELANRVKLLSPERILHEFTMAASYGGPQFAKYVKELDNLSVLEHILPEVSDMKGYRHNPDQHPEGGVWEHTLACLHVSDSNDPIVLFAILLHDMGKPPMMKIKPNGRVSYYKHADKGAEMLDTIADRLRMPNSMRNSLRWAIANHMRFHVVDEMKASKVHALVIHPDWKLLTAVAIADETAQKRTTPNDLLRKIQVAEQLKDRWEKRQAETASSKLVNGNHVMELTGLSPGPKVGKIIKETTEWMLDNNITDQNAIDHYIRVLAIHCNVYGSSNN